jgi:hypothetical protein
VTLTAFWEIKGASAVECQTKNERCGFFDSQKEIGAGHREVPDPDFFTEAPSDQNDNRI